MEKKSIFYEIKFLKPFWFLVGTTSTGICLVHLSYNKEILEQELFNIQNTYRITKEPTSNQKKRITYSLQEIVNYLENPSYSLESLTCDTYGTSFQKAVWQEMRKIPVGKTLFYQDIARKIERPKSYRAVGNACANNKLSLIIPCHRVLSKNKKQNYRWGVDIKMKLLEKEKQSISFLPSK